MEAAKEQLTQQQGAANCRRCEVFQRRKYKLLCQLGGETTGFVDRRALRAITSHEAVSLSLSLIYKAHRLDDS